jgi:hypothetical protein
LQPRDVCGGDRRLADAQPGDDYARASGQRRVGIPVHVVAERIAAQRGR